MERVLTELRAAHTALSSQPLARGKWNHIGAT